MRQYLLSNNDASADVREVGQDWRETKVGAYVNQVLFVNHSPETIGIRNSREMVTLSAALDCLLTGQLARLENVLMQRLKAVESSITDGWGVARHLELIPPSHATITNDQERDYAAKAALRAAKLKESLQKVQKSQKSG